MSPRRLWYSNRGRKTNVHPRSSGAHLSGLRHRLEPTGLCLLCDFDHQAANRGLRSVEDKVVPMLPDHPAAILGGQPVKEFHLRRCPCLPYVLPGRARGRTVECGHAC
jgi:hypothetical protein